MQETLPYGDIPLFSALNEVQRQILASAMEAQRYGAGEDVFAQGAPADGMLVLLTGQAVLFRTNEDGSQAPIATVNAGESLNEAALFGETLQSATMRAAQPCTVLKLTRLAFDQVLSQHPDIGAALGSDAAESKATINPRFAEQREDEEILIQTHRHWWSFVRTAWLPLLLMPALWLGAVLLEAQTVSLILLAISVALPGLALVYFFVEWRNDSVIVTDQRVIRITRTILALHRQVTQVGLESIHEINFDLPAYDPFARLFRYGTVIVKTAGAQGNLELPLMPKPEQFQKLIIENRQYFENREAQRHHKLVRAEMQRWLAGDSTQDKPSAQSSGPPRPLPGSSSYLSTKIEMSNGDIVYRKHISVWAQHTALPLLVILVSLAALVLTFALVSPGLRIVTFPVAMLALLAGCVTYYWLDWDWRNDVYVVSDDTITFVHKRPFFLQNLRDQILVERIDNVESESSGFFATILKYGDVRMSLVGADEPKQFIKVPNPQAIQQEISRRQHDKARRRARYDALQQQQMLGEYLGITPENSGAALSMSSHDLSTGGSHSVGRGKLQRDQQAGSLIRAAHNPDRNRPPRLPRKILAPAQPKADANLQLNHSRRPERFRRDDDAQRKS